MRLEYVVKGLSIKRTCGDFGSGNTLLLYEFKLCVSKVFEKVQFGLKRG